MPGPARLRPRRSITVAGLLAAVVFAPSLVAGGPSAPAEDNCGPNHSAAKALAREAVRVEEVPAKHAGNTRMRYHLAAVTIPASATMPGYHSDAFNISASPGTPVFNSRYYWYTVEQWVDHEYSDVPCTGPDLFGAAHESYCWRRNTQTGDQVDNSQCNHEDYIALQQYYSGAFQAPWGYRVYRETRSSSSCIAVTSDHTLPDGSTVRTWSRIRKRFWLYPGYTDDYLTQARRSATQSVQVYQSNHIFSDNNLYPGFYDGGDAPAVVASGTCG